MKVYSTTELETYQVIGDTLRIHFDHQIIEREGIDGNPEIQHEYEEAVCKITDTRSAIIEKIIGEKYSPGAEFATINNKDSDPEEYAEYQAHRTLAKQLANDWITQK